MPVYSSQVQPALGPNTSVHHRANKFGTMTGKVPVKQERRINPYKTDKDYCFGYAKDYDAFRTRDGFENTAAKTIKARLAMKNMGDDKVMGSFQNSMYRDPDEVRSKVIVYTSEDFADVFHTYADRSDEGDRIQLLDVGRVVRSVMGNDVPDWVVCKFEKLSRRLADYECVTWANFQEIIPYAQEITDYECSAGGAVIPSWLRATSAGGTHRNMVAYKPPSCYMTDFARDRLFDPRALSGEDPKRTSTTRHLFAGSTKVTDQLPGYGGHIPNNVANDRKNVHSAGATLRPQKCDLRLCTERVGAVPGYSGHIPLSTGLEGDRMTGMDLRTTTGAAYRY